MLEFINKFLITLLALILSILKITILRVFNLLSELNLSHLFLIYFSRLRKWLTLFLSILVSSLFLCIFFICISSIWILFFITLRSFLGFPCFCFSALSCLLLNALHTLTLVKIISVINILDSSHSIHSTCIGSHLACRAWIF